VATGIAKPGDGDAVTLFDFCNASAYALNDADALVTGDEREIRLDRPITVGCVDIRVTQAGGFNFDDDLPRFRVWLGNVFHAERSCEITHNCCFHCQILPVLWVKNRKCVDTKKKGFRERWINDSGEGIVFIVLDLIV